MSSHDSNSTDDLKQRVQRVEAELDELRNYHTATDENGNEWSVTKLVSDVGLSRRQALYVIAALAGGTSLISALTDVTSAQAAGGTLYVDQIGDSGNRVSDLYVDTVNSLTDTNTLTANVDGDGHDITNLGAFGADEVNDTQYLDSAAEIKTELEAASDGDSFVIEKGSYTVDNPIQITSEINVLGLGKAFGSTLTKANDANLIELRDSRISLINLNFEGINGTTDGIYTEDSYGTDRCRIEDCRVTNMGRDGIHMGKCNLGHFENITAEGNGRYGFYSGGPDANAYTAINLDLKSNTDDGYHNDGSYGANLVGGYSAGNGGAGWYLDNDQIMVAGIGGEANTDDDVVVGPNSNHCKGFVGRGSIDTSAASTAWILGDFNNVHMGNGFQITFDDSGRMEFQRPGRGVIMTTPDGTDRYEVTVDNSGNLVTTLQ